MKKHTSLLFVAAACASLCAAAIPSQAAGSGLTLKAGAELQNNAQTYHSNNVAFGAEYVLVHPTAVSPVSVSLYGDLLGDSSGAGISVRSATPFYLGAGVGFYHASITPAGGGPASIPPPGFPSQPAPPYTANGTGGKIFAGFEVAKIAGLEAGYHFMPAANGYTTSAVSLQLALHL